MTKTQPLPKNQRQAFIDAARKAECDESEAAFEGKLRRIAQPSQKAAKTKRKK